MKRKDLVYITGLALVVLVLAVAVFVKVNATGNTGQNPKNSQDLAKYRSETIPAECRLSEYESSIDAWKEHLSHHQNTLYCLDYFK